MTKTLVLFVFHELNDRIRTFICQAIFFDADTDFILISNDKSNELRLSTLLPPYVKVLYRDNIGYDFGGWSDGLLEGELYRGYENFIFVNSSVVGPFIVPYYKGRWTDIYLGELTDTLQLFGSTINTIQDPLNKSHVQSYIFAMKRETLEFLMINGIFSRQYAQNFGEAIWNKEILMSRMIIARGGNIGSLLPQYKGVDFRFHERSPESYGIQFLDDVMFQGFRGSLWNEFQLVFVKGNRITF
jgi:lipopolysaccharide biosynthesis protein